MKYQIINYLRSLFKKINMSYAYIAFMHWYISFFTDRFVFDYESIDDIRLFIYKGVFFAILFIIWQFVGCVVKEYKKNENIRIFIRYSLIYFAIMMIFLLFTWPGIWRFDEFNIFRLAIVMRSLIWNGVLMDQFYIFSLMLLPFPAGIIIIQNIIISLIVGYVISKFQHHFRINNVLICFAFLPFLLFPVIDNNLYPTRTTLYAYMILLLSFKIILIKHYDKVRTTDFIIIFVITLFISLSRSEGLIYAFLLPVFLYISFYKQSNIRQKIMIFFLFIFICMITFVVNKNTLEKYYGKKYELYPMVSSVSELYLQSDTDTQLKNLPKIEKIMEFSEFSKGSFVEILDVAKDFTEQDYNEFKKMYFQLILNYPSEYLSLRYKLFTLVLTPLGNTMRLYDSEDLDYGKIKKEPFFKLFIPVNANIRKNAISFIERLDFNKKRLKYCSLLYNLLLPTIIMVLVMFLSFVFKRYAVCFVCALILFHTLMVFLTAPTPLFMYYFYLYLCSFVFAAMLIIFLINKHRMKFGD